MTPPQACRAPQPALKYPRGAHKSDPVLNQQRSSVRACADQGADFAMAGRAAGIELRPVMHGARPPQGVCERPAAKRILRTAGHRVTLVLLLNQGTNT